MSEQLDNILNKISLAFGVENLELVFPEDMIVELTLFKISKIDTANLDEEIEFCSKVYMLFEVILAHVTDKANRAEAYLKQLNSKLSLKYEKHLNSTGDRVSDKKIEKLVESDDGYTDAVNKRLDYNNLVTTFKNILTGLDKKHDLLIQLSSKRNKMIGDKMI